MINKSQNIAIDLIVQPKEELRSTIIEEKFLELVSSIKKLGILQPILVTKAGSKYEIVAGTRRYLAAQQAKLATVPAIIVSLRKNERSVATLHENLMREDVNHLDVARYLAKVLEDTKATQAGLAGMFGYSPAWVASHLKLLKLPNELQAAVEAEQIDIDSALSLSRITAPKRRLTLLGYAIRDGASQAAIRRWVQDELGTSATAPAQSGRLDKVTSEATPEPMKFICFLCKKEHGSDDMILVRLNSECYTTLRKAVKVEGGRE